MKIYLVGGAVRDRLLGYPVKERDWVVVGATSELMTQQGYVKVGRDFPVFLHPKTHEEYALARTERKQGHGYYGFSCQFDPTVTLEEDLMRRDLTINAMAMDEDQRLIDPYRGQSDLKAKIFRHISPAFIEDPVRLLRVARFMARYYHLGFRLAPETEHLMREMVCAGDVNYLVPERVWQEWSRSLSEQHPEMFLYVLRQCGALRVLFPEIDGLFGIPNQRDKQGEIDSGVHTLMVLNQCAGVSDDSMVRFAATVHDIGKSQTSHCLWPEQHHYEIQGRVLIEGLCRRLNAPRHYRQFSMMTSQLSPLIQQLATLSASQVIDVLERADAFRRPDLFEKLLLVSLADGLGRGRMGNYPAFPWLFPSQKGVDLDQKKSLLQTIEEWRLILAGCRQITGAHLLNAGCPAEDIRVQLHDKRAEHVEMLRQQLGLKHQ